MAWTARSWAMSAPRESPRSSGEPVSFLASMPRGVRTVYRYRQTIGNALFVLVENQFRRQGGAAMRSGGRRVGARWCMACRSRFPPWHGSQTGGNSAAWPGHERADGGKAGGTFLKRELFHQEFVAGVKQYSLLGNLTIGAPRLALVLSSATTHFPGVDRVTKRKRRGRFPHRRGQAPSRRPRFATTALRLRFPR